MVLLRKGPTWGQFFLRCGAGFAVFLPVSVKYADYKSRLVDKEFLWSPTDLEDVARDQRQQLRTAAAESPSEHDRDVRVVTRKRYEQIVTDCKSEGAVPARLDNSADLKKVGRPSTMPRTDAAAMSLSEVGPRLRTGDIALFMGTGAVSWQITRLAFIFSGFNLDALRYSHVGMVVGPLPQEGLSALAEYKRRQAGGSAEPKLKKSSSWWGKDKSTEKDEAEPAPTGPSPTPCIDAIVAASAEGGPIIIEAIDNKDCNARNILPDPSKLLHDQVMVSRLEDRAMGVDYRESKPRWCYNRLTMRRVENIRWSPEMIAEFEAWLQKSMGRPMDKNKTLPLAMMDPRLHSRKDPRIVSCSEIVADGLRSLRVMPDVPLDGWRQLAEDNKRRGTSIHQVLGRYVPSVMYAPMHFATLGEAWCDWNYLPPASAGHGSGKAMALVRPEERVLMTMTKDSPPSEPDATRYWPKEGNAESS